MSEGRDSYLLKVSLLFGVWQRSELKPTLIKPGLAIEVEKGGDGWSKDIGVENTRLDASSSKREGQVH